MSPDGTWGNQRHKSHRQKSKQQTYSVGQLYEAMGSLPITEYEGTPPVNLNSVPPTMKGKSMDNGYGTPRYTGLSMDNLKRYLTDVAVNLKTPTPTKGYGLLAVLNIEKVVDGKMRRHAEVEYFIETAAPMRRVTIKETVAGVSETIFTVMIYAWGNTWRIYQLPHNRTYPEINPRLRHHVGKVIIGDKEVGLGAIDFASPHDVAQWLYRALYGVEVITGAFPAYQAVR